MTAWLLAALGLAAAPAIPVPDTSDASINHARSLWLLGCVAVTVAWLAPREPWLACIGAWFLCRWRGGDEALGAKPVAALVSWAGVGVTWFAMREVPAYLLVGVSHGWVILAWVGSLFMVEQRFLHGNRQPHGWLGQRSIAAGLYVLTVPFCPWWALPGPLVGLWLTGPAWGACLALAASTLWLLPLKWIPWAAGGLLGAVAILFAPIFRGPTGTGYGLIGLTPRGDTFDGVRERWRTVRVCWEEIRRDRRWLRGVGPGQGELTAKRWVARMRDKEAAAAMGDMHFTPAQIWFEYGVFGLAAMACFAWEVGRRMTWGDPWSAAALGGALFACSTWGFRLAPLGVLWLCIAAGVGR